MTTTEPDLFRGYGDTARDHALRVIVEERIAELLRYRAWYRANRWADWTLERTEHAVELWALVRLARQARKMAGTARDPIDAYRAGAERGVGYHDVQAR